MNILFSWADAPAAHTFGLVLLHTLWQALLAAAALWLALKTLPAARARLRYAAAAAALAAVVIAAAVTHGVVNLPTDAATPSAPSANAYAASTPAPFTTSTLAGAASSSASQGTPHASPHAVPWPAVALLAWAAIAGLLILRTLHALIATRRLTRGPGVTRVEPWAHDLLAEVQQRMHLRRAVRLIASTAAHTPVVLGALFPVIVLPPALAAGLTTQQMRVVLAHELAHIKRHDYLVNLIQRLVEALLFFNPAVWFITRQIRLEREAACDSAAANALGGNRLHVARTLVDVLQQLAPTSPRPTAALALGQPNEPALTTRVRRLLHPHLRDAVRIPWPTLLLLLALSGGALYGVACGSEATAVAIDKIVNPQKYVAETRRTVAENTPPKEYRYTNGQVPPEDRVTVAGTVVAHDNADLSGRDIYVRLSGQGGATTLQLRADPDNPRQMRFTHASHPGVMQVLIHVAGYGPAMSAPLTLKPGTTRGDLHLILPPGRDLPVRVTDSDGQPIAGVRFKQVSQIVQQRGGFSSYPVRHDDPATDSSGRMVIPNTGPVLYKGLIQHPGYELAEFEITPQPGDTWNITLQPALPLGGVVTSAANGKPLPAARIRMVWNSVTNAQTDPRSSSSRSPPLATTDGQGRFTLSTLPRHALHSLWVEADGHAPMILHGIATRADAPTLQVQLATGIRPRFRVEGPLELLETDRKGTPRIQIRQTVHFKENSPYGTSFYAYPDPDSDGRTFTFDAPLIDHAEETTVTAGQTHLRLDDLRPLATQPHVLTLTPKDAEPDTRAVVTRTVIIRLAPPAGWPPPEGTAQVFYRVNASDRYRTNTELPITEGEIRFEVLLDTPEGSRQGPGFALESVAAPGYWLPLSENHTARQTQVSPGDDPLTLDRQLQPAGIVTGRVTDEAGDPLPDANLHLNIIEQPPSGRLDSNSVNNFRTDGQGRFALFPAPFGGTYRVSASSGSLGRYAGVRTAAFTLHEANPKKEIDITIPRGTDVAVTVLDPTGNPLANVPVDVHLSRPGGGNSWSPGERTGGSGVAVLTGIDLAAPQATWSIAIGQVENYQPTKITLDRPTTSVTLQPGSSVTGQVIDAATQAPVPGLTLKAVIPPNERVPGLDWNQDAFTTTTGPDGSFTLRGLTPGRTYQAWFKTSKAAEAASIRRDAAGKITGIRHDGTRFTAPADPNGKAAPLTLRVVVNPWDR